MHVTTAERRGFCAAFQPRYAEILIGMLELRRQGHLAGLWLKDHGTLAIRKPGELTGPPYPITWEMAALLVKTFKEEKCPVESSKSVTRSPSSAVRVKDRSRAWGVVSPILSSAISH